MKETEIYDETRREEMKVLVLAFWLMMVVMISDDYLNKMIWKSNLKCSRQHLNQLMTSLTD
ncbi:hypothetical protein LIER_15135 [Lithospermum erythrorhizon]|uniref:Transmembrane protein n=1 Tax=Lithospermum erythrorhizon TaxID=34254 RepID=A0AAV3Q5S4_LITER